MSRKVSSDGADVTSSGRLFQTWGPATGKALSPTEDRLDCGWMKRLVLAKRTARRLVTYVRIGLITTRCPSAVGVKHASQAVQCMQYARQICSFLVEVHISHQITCTLTQYIIKPHRPSPRLLLTKVAYSTISQFTTQITRSINTLPLRVANYH